MLPPTNMRNWARHLLASEVIVSTTSGQAVSATGLVYEKLRSQLCAPVGIEGFRALASRALALAKAEAPRLSSVQITAEGRLHGLTELESQMEPVQECEVGIVLIAHLLGLFLSFMGAATTQRLVRDIFPPLDVLLETDAAIPFEIILEEASQLRNITERLVSLAARNPAVEEGLTRISESIRDIATILDVFVTIKDRPDGYLDAQTPEYLM